MYLSALAWTFTNTHQQLHIYCRYIKPCGTVMYELLFRHCESKDCLFGNPYWDLKWYCRQKLCRKSGGVKNNKKNQLPSPKHLCSLTFTIITTPPPFQQKKKQNKEAISNNTNKPQLYSPKTQLCASCRRRKTVCCVDFALHHMNLFL